MGQHPLPGAAIAQPVVVGRGLDSDESDHDANFEVQPLRSANFELPEDSELSQHDCRRLEEGSLEVRQLMREQGLSFDEARLQLVLKSMEQMGIDASGMPQDPKTVTFGSRPACTGGAERCGRGRWPSLRQGACAAAEAARRAADGMRHPAARRAAGRAGDRADRKASDAASTGGGFGLLGGFDLPGATADLTHLVAKPLRGHCLAGPGGRPGCSSAMLFLRIAMALGAVLDAPVPEYGFDEHIYKTYTKAMFFFT